MTALAGFIFNMLDWAIIIYIWVIIIYCLAGFFVQNRYAKWYVLLQELAEPPLAFVRRITSHRLMIDRFDLSPILVLVALQLLRALLGSVRPF